MLLALTDTHHGFYLEAARYARKHGWHLVTDMIYTASIPYGWQGDGILSFIGHRNDLAEFILSNPAPAVEISLVRDDVDLPRVAADNRMIGRVAAEPFIERGFRRCLWVPFRDDVPNRERRDGFFETLAKAGITAAELPTTAWAAGQGGPASRPSPCAWKPPTTASPTLHPKPATHGQTTCSAPSPSISA